MMKFLRTLLAAVVLTGTMLLPGCDMMHNLKPHRLHRLNRGLELGGGADAYNWSVSDDVPEPDEPADSAD